MVHLFIFLNEEKLIGVLVNLKKKKTWRDIEQVQSLVKFLIH